ncbi:ATP nucleotide 3'-pyrophosphokinase [Streptomyces sp. NPDC048172]|uniref:ATP nucleotide 3'-pyrophosphokinase n=1 Tax=Streptomyces sp. NPDC048172 TaxID=3365505 RepID=UPI003711212C
MNVTPTPGHRRTGARLAGTLLAASFALGALQTGGAWAASAAPAVPAPSAAPPIAPADEPGSWHSQGLSLDAVENRQVDRYLERARGAERVISTQIREAARRNGAELVGFGQRLKSPDSLKRKVATYMKGDEKHAPTNVDQALKQVNDAVRYTFVWDDEKYTKGVRGASHDLTAWQYNSVRWSNTWDSKDRYKGINSAWRDPLRDQKFEIQFHTPASKSAQERTHKIYEEQRLPSTPPARKAELQREQGRIFAAVPVPEGAEALTAPAQTRPLPVPARVPAQAPAA